MSSAPSVSRPLDRRDFIQAGGLGLIGLGLERSVAVRRGQAHRLTILHTADIHGQLEIHDEFFWENGRAVFKKRGGLATLRTMIQAIRKESPGTVLLVDGGDTFQGSAVASLSQGRAIVPLINRLGYDLLLPGNWEVLYGKALMLRNFSRCTSAKVCANMFDDADNHPLFPPYRVFDIGGGARVGFIGYNDPLTPIRQSPAYSLGIRFTRPEESLAGHVRTLREEQRCDLVCVLSHLGLAQQLNLANDPSARGVDYVLGADTHERIREPLPGKFAKVTEPGAFGSFIAKLDLVLENGRVKDESYALLDVDPDRYGEDAEMRKMVTVAKAPYRSELSRVVGRTTTPVVRYYIVETPMDNLITDALMWRFKTNLVLSNGFRFCPPLAPGRDGVAEITMEYLWSMLPVDSYVKTAEVTGAQLVDWLELELENVFAADPTKRFGGWLVRFKGMKVRFRANEVMGKRVEDISIADHPLDRDRSYSILACERDGDPDNVLCRMKGVANPQRLEVKLHDVMVDYLAKFSPVSPMVEGRAVAVDAPPDLLSQVQGTTYRFR
ncbi:MAG: bifunctional metallophosphatase/5'-nucleotidase [Gemmatimonadota bacterium]